MRSLSLIMMCLIASPLAAAEVEWVKVKRSKRHIDITSEIVIDAPVSEVYDALLEYDVFADVSEDFTESRYIEPAPDGTPRIYTKIEGCIWFFCRTVERTAQLKLYPRWKITAVAEPELSDAELSIETWALTANGDRTTIDYSHEIETGFWVPPLIGTLVIRGTVKRSALDAAIRIEDLAHAAMEQTGSQTAGQDLSTAE